uniref:Protein amnionless n=1 Tax=Clastoptera arizonana TaxID=38151 RepID=A0A1B6CBN0_9HEMI
MIFIVLIRVLFLTSISALQRHWLRDIDYNNKDNWDVGHVPCGADHVLFPERMNFAVELPSVMVTPELVLPNSGEIILSETGSIEISTTPVLNCKGEDATFKIFEAAYWTDANNWDGWNNATPHVERIPCQSDRVVFSTEGTFRVVMPSETVQIAALTIGGEEMDTLSWEDFSKSEVGRQQFYTNKLRPPKVEISSEALLCSSSGCECFNSYLETSICSRISCQVATCFTPVRPMGSCCDLCGAVLLFGYTRTFSMKNLKQKIKEAVQSSDWSVVWHVRKYGDVIQLVLVEDGEYAGNIEDISHELKDILLKQNNGLLVKSVHSSGPVYYPMTFGKFLMRFFFTMIASFVFIAAIFVYYYGNTGLAIRRFLSDERRPFLFARFENQSGDTIRLRNSSEQSISIVSLPQAFDNPMYGSADQTPKDVTIGNPIYTELITEEAEEDGDIELKEEFEKEIVEEKEEDDILP